jgi:hypothetical protein
VGIFSFQTFPAVREYYEKQIIPAASSAIQKQQLKFPWNFTVAEQRQKNKQISLNLFCFIRK